MTHSNSLLPAADALTNAGTKAAITTHILNLDTGLPAVGVAVTLSYGGECLAHGVTNNDGRVLNWSAPFQLKAGVWQLVFDTYAFYASQGETAFYPSVQLQFLAAEGQAHYHIPLLLNRFGYSTYRGS